MKWRATFGASIAALASAASVGTGQEAGETTVFTVPVRPAVLTRNFGPTTTPDEVKWNHAVADEAYRVEPVHWRRHHGGHHHHGGWRGGWHGGWYGGWSGAGWGFHVHRPYYGYRPFYAYRHHYAYRPYYVARPHNYRPYYYSFGPTYYAPSVSVQVGPVYSGCYHW